MYFKKKKAGLNEKLKPKNKTKKGIKKMKAKNANLRNKGITLIALVVTIIVLLILAGVSISMLTGQNRNIK